MNDDEATEMLKEPKSSWCACCHRHIEKTSGFGIFVPGPADAAFFARHGVGKIGYHLCELCSKKMVSGNKARREVAEQVERYFYMGVATGMIVGSDPEDVGPEVVE